MSLGGASYGRRQDGEAGATGGAVSPDLATFQDELTKALNAHGVPATPSWQEAIDWLAEHGGRKAASDEDRPPTGRYVNP